jgi:hypothetical protein
LASGGLIEERRRIVGSGIFPWPAHSVCDFASDESEVAEHAIVHVREFVDRPPRIQFGFDCSPRLRKESE